MKQIFKSALAVVAGVAAMAGTAAVMSTAVSAANHTMYSLEDANKLDHITLNSIKVTGDHNTKTGGDYDWYKKTYGKELPDGMLKNESNFVGARVNNGENKGKYNKWDDDITVEDGKSYIVRIYVHNNNPNGVDAIAENVKTRFFVPTLISNSITVNGWVTSSNATPNEYVDDVVFKSDIPFHLEYVKGSALLENGNYASGAGKPLSDAVIADGTLIGYDGLDGRIPGCYKYVNYVTIEVKAVFDYDYKIEKKVRLAGTKEWSKTVDAKVGDKVEFQIEYTNTSNKRQEGVVIRDVLPSNLRYVAGSTKIKNENHPKGDRVLEDYLVEGGLAVGNYGPNANVYILLTAEVVNDNLACGSNTMVNWGRASVGEQVIQDYARVHTDYVCKNTDEPTDDPKPTPDPIDKLPTAGPEAVAGGVIATGSIVTAAGYYIASRRQLR